MHLLKSMNVYYQNVRGLKSKTSEFLSNILSRDIDIIVLTETWLNDSIHCSELFDKSYVVYRVDRDLSRTAKLDGGGCLVAIKSKYFSCRLNEWEVTDGDLWVSIEQCDNERVYINVKYINCNSTIDQYNAHFDKIEEIINVSAPNSEFLLLGDYNLSDSITWSVDSDGVCNPQNVQGVKKLMAHALIDSLSLTNMKQFSCIKNNKNRTLDLVISNIDPSKLSLIEDVDPLVKIDKQHPALLISVNLKPLKYLNEKRLPKFNFFRANYTELNRLIQCIDWKKELEHLNVDEAVSRFYELIRTLLVNVPKIRRMSNKFPCWYSGELIRLINHKSIIKQIHDAKKKEGIDTTDDYALFSNLRKQVKQLQMQCERVYVSDIEEKLSSNTKCFFSYTKSQRASNSLPNVVHCDNATATDRQSVCNLFADYFASVYQRPDQEIVNGDQLLTDFVMTPIETEEVKSILIRLDQYKVSSPDDIPAIFYKNLSDSISQPLSLLYNKSVKEGKCPELWKISYVLPTFKSGNRSKVENYRPISILCAISKVMERIMFNRLYAHVKDHISAYQHGFIPDKSVQSNLLEYVNFIVESISQGGQVDTIFTDFSKAFDKVSHNLLIQDLEKVGVKGSYKSWFHTYLTDRTQFVMIGSTKSKDIKPSSGIPQGSILGPLLFLIFINSLPSIFRSSWSSLFADDHKLSKKINNELDCNALQEDLDVLSEWCKNRLLDLNVKKCHALTITYKPEKIDFDYKINGENTTKVSVKKDLGVEFDEKIKFNHHMSNVTRKCYQMIGFIFRTTKAFKKPKSLITLYYTYVRSRLEYSCPVWNPQYIKYIDLIERVQRKFTRLLYYRFNWIKPDYKTRLKQLHMHSLETRRLQLDEMLLYNIINGKLKTALSSQISFHQPRRFTRNPPKFYLPTPSANYVAHEPVYRIQHNHDAIFSSLDLKNPSQYAFRRAVKTFFDYGG